jgi:uncharacterized protein (UPF0276 family)
MTLRDIAGAGLSLKRELMEPLQAGVPPVIDFFEIAPENWIGVGGRRAELLAWFIDRYPFVAHGLSLSLGGPDPLNEAFLQQVRAFLDRHRISLFTEHLSYCSDAGYLYDLLPIPFTEEAVRYVAARIRRTQDILERRIAVENASFYVAAPINEMQEIEFIRAVLAEADCDLHLDVKNVYVTSVNFGFDPYEFLHAIPADRVVYMHTAGHWQEAPDLIIDTHGEPVIEPVWALLAEAYRLFGPVPTLLERDINLPPLPALVAEVRRIAELQAAVAKLEATA